MHTLHPALAVPVVVAVTHALAAPAASGAERPVPGLLGSVAVLQADIGESVHAELLSDVVHTLRARTALRVAVAITDAVSAFVSLGTPVPRLFLHANVDVLVPATFLTNVVAADKPRPALPVRVAVTVIGSATALASAVMPVARSVLLGHTRAAELGLAAHLSPRAELRFGAHLGFATHPGARAHASSGAVFRFGAKLGLGAHSSTRTEPGLRAELRLRARPCTGAILGATAEFRFRAELGPRAILRACDVLRLGAELRASAVFGTGAVLGLGAVFGFRAVLLDVTGAELRLVAPACSRTISRAIACDISRAVSGSGAIPSAVAGAATMVGVVSRAVSGTIFLPSPPPATPMITAAITIAASARVPTTPVVPAAIPR